MGVKTKQSPLTASDTHIALIGDITIDELKREITTTALVNGFVNRFLIGVVGRSKVLPDPPALSPATIASLGQALEERARRGSMVGLMRRDAEATELWKAVYTALTAERPGILDHVLARAEAHVLRLSLIYSLLDGSDVVTAKHLQSALALWDYCERSATYIFGSSSGTSLSDKLLDLLEAGSMHRTAISEALGKNVPKYRIDEALGLLSGQGLVESTDEPTGGRPREVWQRRG